MESSYKCSSYLHSSTLKNVLLKFRRVLKRRISIFQGLKEMCRKPEFQQNSVQQIGVSCIKNTSLIWKASDSECYDKLYKVKDRNFPMQG